MNNYVYKQSLRSLNPHYNGFNLVKSFASPASDPIVDIIINIVFYIKMSNLDISAVVWKVEAAQANCLYSCRTIVIRG